jgi:uncharacterized protein
MINEIKVWKFLLIIVITVISLVGHKIALSSPQRAHIITGRLMDSRGEPVNNGTVVIIPSSSVENRRTVALDQIIPYFSTDSEGRFAIDAPSKDRSAILYCASGLNSNVGCIVPIKPPYDGLLTTVSRFSGFKITINNNGNTDLGDIICHTFYGSIDIKISSEKSLLFDRLRVRDALGNIVHESLLAKAVTTANSLCLTLPVGSWFPELGRDQCTIWYSIGKIVVSADVRRTHAVELTAVDKVAKSLFDQPSDFNKPENISAKSNTESLFKSAKYGNRSAIQLLLDRGVDPNMMDQNGATALIQAAAGCYLDVVNALIAGGADPNIIGNSGITALMAASGGCECGLIARELLDHGADSNKKTIDGITALMLAAGNGHIEAVRYLLAAGADQYAKDDNGRTALDFARGTGRTDIIQLLGRK